MAWSQDVWVDARTKRMVRVQVPGADVYDPDQEVARSSPWGDKRGIRILPLAWVRDSIDYLRRHSLIRKVLLRSRLAPQGRWTRGILAAAGAFLFFVALAGMFLWVVNQSNGARMLTYGALGVLLVVLMAGFARTVRDKMRAWLGPGLMVSGAICLVATAASGGMFDWVLSRPSRDLANRDWANQPETLTKVGQAAPEFDVTTLDGGRMNLADLRGKVVVLNFFATWCGPCQQEMFALEQKVWQPFKKKPLAVISINCKETDEKVKGFRQKHGCTFSMATDHDGIVYAKYATKKIPRTYVIDRNGIIAYQCTGFWAPEMENMR